MAAHVLAHGAKLSDQPALELLHTDHSEVWTYGTLRAAVAGVATGLRMRGLTPGDRILMRLGNVLGATTSSRNSDLILIIES